MEEKYFAASNSKNGFISYYGELIEPCERVFIIKGGPGTGKSYFMRCVARELEARGHAVIYIYCSSDQSSLDGIIIDGRIAIVDGTAPHAVEASLPGVRDTIVDLGAFLDSDRLMPMRTSAKALAKKKSAAYSRAYECLAAAGKLCSAADSIYAPFLLSDKISRRVDRIISDLPHPEVGGERTLCISSVGMLGRAHFDTLRARAKNIICIRGSKTAANAFLSALRSAARARGIKAISARDPIVPEQLEALELGGVLFLRGDGECHRSINADLFVSRDIKKEDRREARRLAQLSELCIERSELALSEAAKSHFELEAIFGAAMDFDAKEKFTAHFIDSLALALK